MTSAMICIDASFIVRYFTSSSTESIYQQYWSQWQTKGYNIVAPTLIIYEVCNAFHRASVAGQITQEEAEQFLERALNLGLRFSGDAELHRQALKIAQRHNLPATYDSHYLALAERLGIEFWTADRRLFNAVHSSLSWVNLVR